MAVSDLFAKKGSFFKHEQKTRYEMKKEASDAAETAWRKVCAVVDARDKRMCRACGRKCDPNATDILHRAERHHITYRSAGGKDISENLALLCAGCHSDEHRHRLKIEGNADVALTFYRSLREGEFYIARQETAPHVLVPRD